MTGQQAQTFEAIAELVRTLDQNRLEQQKAQIQQQVHTYLSEAIARAGNVSTPGILEEADRLYDISGMPSVIADALGYGIADLQMALARKRTIECVECHKAFVVTEKRRIGGYQPSDAKICPRCKQLQQRKERERREAAGVDDRLTKESALERGRMLELQIVGAPDALVIPEFREKLKEFLIVWTTDDEEIGEARRMIVPGPWNTRTETGCMICGLHPVGVAIAPEGEILPDTYDAELRLQVEGLPTEWPGVRSAFDETGYDIVTVWQLIWRLHPRWYFGAFLPFPLTTRPLLILCEDCAGLVASEYTWVGFEDPMAVPEME